MKTTNSFWGVETSFIAQEKKWAIISGTMMTISPELAKSITSATTEVKEWEDNTSYSIKVVVGRSYFRLPLDMHCVKKIQCVDGEAVEPTSIKSFLLWKLEAGEVPLTLSELKKIANGEAPIPEEYKYSLIRRFSCELAE